MHVESELYRFQNGVLGPAMEHPVGTVNSGYVHAGFVSRALLKIRKIPSSIALTNSAIEARGYCKSFLPLWRCTISAPSVECASFTVQSCEERVTRNLMGGSALDVESGSYWLKNGVLVLFMEHSFHGGTVNYFATCATDDILPIANVFAIVSPLAISFCENMCITFMLILEAP